MSNKLNQFSVRVFSAVLIYVLSISFGFAQSLDLKFDHYTSETGLPQNTIHGIAKDKYGFMWFGTWSGLCKFDGYKFKVYRYDPSNPRSINNNRIHNIIKDSNQDLWIQTFDVAMACKYNYETDDFERVPDAQLSPAFRKLLNRRDHYLNVSFTRKNYQWRVNDISHSLIQKYLPGGSQKEYSSNSLSRWSLNDSYVTDIYLDNHSIFWVGTFSNGINKANLNAKPFNYFYHDPKDPNSIIDNNVRAICEDKAGNLWIGTREKGITVLRKDKGALHLQHSASNSNTIVNNEIKMLFCDSRGFLWIGTKTGLDSYDPSTSKIRHFTLQGLENTTVFDAMEDHQGNVWFASWKGVYKYISKSDNMVHFDPSGTLANQFARTIMEDSKHQIWVGTEGGGVSVLKETSPGKISIVNHFNHYKTPSRNTLSDNRIYSILEDIDGYVWIGTGNGLERFDPRKQTFKRFSVSPNGLTDAMIVGILEDDNGYVWVSHKRGISQINKKSFAIRNYSLQDGLQSNEFSDATVYKSHRTRMLYFGGINGYNAFYPDSIQPEKTVPEVVLTELQILNKAVEVGAEVNGRVLLKKPLYLSSEINLTYRDKSIAIEFAGLHYSNPEGNKYAYMLEGFDKDWIYTDASRRLATYSNLEPGKYVFKVKASNCDGIWNPVPKMLNVTVAPAFWLSNLAYFFYALIIAGLLYAFYYYSVRYAKLKSKLTYESILHEKDLELHESKIRFFTNISHEIKTPLSLILAPIERLMAGSEGRTEEQNQLRTMKDSGDRLLKLINQLLDIRRFETGNDKLVLEKRDLVKFVREIVYSFQQMALQRDITLELISQAAPFYTGFDPDKIEKVLYNLLSNSFKFTKDGGKILVYLRQIQESSSEFVVIEVVDNGTGIPAQDTERIFKPFQQGSLNKSGGTGLGLAYCKGLVELHGGTISFQSTTGMGEQNSTTFTVKFPVRLDIDEDLAAGDAHLELENVNSADLESISSEPLQDAVSNEQGKMPTLLLVEDNFEMRKYLRESFSEQYIILEASNGIEGLQLAVEHSPDIIVSDVMMPEMDGIELCKRLKADILTSHIPVILLTARTPIEYQIEGIETGADDYIVKPFNFTLLSLKIKNMLLSRARLREKFKAKVSIQPSSINPESPDEKLLKKLLGYIEERISDPELNINDICDRIGLSRTQLYRKMKALTGLSMAEVLKEVRLKRAQQLLRDKKFNVSEITYMVGFTDTDYFRRCFKAEFGVSPSEYSKMSAEEQKS